MAYNLFWFSGTIIDSAIRQSGDWAYLTFSVHLGQWSKPVLLVSGMLFYFIFIRLSRQKLKEMQEKLPGFTVKPVINYAYLFAVLVAILAGLFYSIDSLSAAREGMLEMLASLPVLIIGINSKFSTNSKELEINKGYYILTIIFLAFCFSLGRGIY